MNESFPFILVLFSLFFRARRSRQTSEREKIIIREIVEDECALRRYNEQKGDDDSKCTSRVSVFERLIDEYTNVVTVFNLYCLYKHKTFIFKDFLSNTEYIHQTVQCIFQNTFFSFGCCTEDILQGFSDIIFIRRPQKILTKVLHI